MFFSILSNVSSDRLLLLIYFEILSSRFTLFYLPGLNKFELLSPFASFIDFPIDFLELKNFTSFMLKDGLSFYIEFCINFYLLIALFSLNSTDFDVYLFPEYLELDFLIWNVYLFISSINFFAKFIFPWLLFPYIWELYNYIFVFEAFVSLFTLLLKMDLFIEGSSFGVDSFWPLSIYFLWILNPDLTGVCFY